MSILERVSAFVEDEDILAPAFEEEFDNIANAFNGLFKMGEVAGTNAAQGLGTSYADVTGASASFTTDRNMTFLVIPFAELRLPHTEGVAVLNVDGSDKSRTFNFYSAASSAGAGVATAYIVSLSPGSHVLKLRAKGTPTEAQINGTRSGFAYIGVAT